MDSTTKRLTILLEKALAYISCVNGEGPNVLRGLDILNKDILAAPDSDLESLISEVTKCFEEEE